MKNTIIDFEENIVVSTASGDENNINTVITNKREELIEALIDTIPAFVPCTYHSRNHPSSTIFGQGTDMYVNFTMDDGETYLVFYLAIYYGITPGSLNGISLSAGFSGNHSSLGTRILDSTSVIQVQRTNGATLRFRAKITTITTKSFLKPFQVGVDGDEIQGLIIIRVNFDTPFPHRYKWYQLNNENLYTPGSTFIVARLVILSTVGVPYGSGNNQSLLQIPLMIEAENYYVGKVDAENNDIILTSPMSISTNGNALIDGTLYNVVTGTTKRSILVKI